MVLSGTGFDGTLGLRAVVGGGGVTFVQDPATATYDGMPSSAIRSGFATHVLPVERMPEAMRIAAARTPGVRRPVRRPLQVRTGAHPGPRHPALPHRPRLLPVQAEHGRAPRGSPHGAARHPGCRRLRPLPKEHPAEVQPLFRDLLINVTSFFRDREAFEALARAPPPRSSRASRKVGRSASGLPAAPPARRPTPSPSRSAS